MTERHFEADLTGDTGRLVVDGHDVTNGVQGFILTAGHNKLPELTIEAAVLTGRVQSDQAEVILHLPDEARRALILAGWTPPAGEEEYE